MTGDRALQVGVSWYPEQWPTPRWPTDVAMMAELGLDLVRIGEFAWSRLEPFRDRFDWGWLDHAIELLGDAGLQVVLGTPTAAPPVWLTRQRPDILTVGPDGRRRAAGSRRHASTSSPAYREEAARIVTAMVARYGRHPAVVAWQVDNEPGNHDSARCFSDAATERFRRWLAQRYPTIDALNDAWGLAFWSGAYPSFDAIELPVPTVTAHSPSLRHAHRAFATAEVAEGLAQQRAIITAGSPGRTIMTNLYLADVDVDPVAVARPTGLAALDLYPHGVSGPAEAGFVLDLARGSALRCDAGPADGGGRAWVTEAQVGTVYWTADNPVVPPGQVTQWAWQAALHGVEALLWFRWRAPRAGQEQHATALLRHDGTPDTGHGEVARFLAELAAVPAQRLERAPARIALVHDVTDAWMIAVTSHLDAGSHRALNIAAYTGARRLGWDVDVVPPDADLTGYEVVIATGLHQVTDDRLRRLQAALAAGATVVLGPRTLVRDVHAVWVDQPLPCSLTERLGARVDHVGSPRGWPHRSDAVTEIAIGGEVLPTGGWIETFHLDAPDVEVVARGRGGPLDGAPVVVRRGQLVAVGAASPEVWTRVLSRLTGRVPVDDDPDVEVFERGGHQVVLDHRRLTIEWH